MQDGNDYLDISNGGNDTVWAGAGADVIDVGAAFNSGDAILGDTPGTTSAIDTLRIAGEYDQAVVFGAGTVFSIEKYEIGSGGTVRLTLLDDGLFAGVDNMAAYPRFDASGQTSGDAFILDASAITIGQNGYYASITAFGGAGNDYLATGAGNDTISSGAGDDTLHGNSGNDTLSGGDGADSLSGGDGADVLDGGAGADSLSGDAGNDTLDGGSEMDTLLGGDGADLLTGGAGEDLLAGDWGNDTLDGGHDMDTLNGGDGADLLTGGAGADYLFGEGGNDTVDGGAGNDLIAADPGNNTYLFGRGDGQDVVYYSGTDGFNTLQLKAGVQTSDIVVRRAYDVFLGDNQALEVSIYGTSDKIVFNRPYEDTPANPFSVQQIRFADGTVWNVSTIVNRLNVGSPGADTLRGSAAADMIYGDAGDDDLSGGDGHDYINGGEGADTVAGEAGFDVLNGDAGNDSMVGGAGDDSLNGGEGDDTADGGAGNDTFNDGYGSNVYLFGKGDGQDLVYFSSDFTWGKLSTLQFKPNVLPSEVVLTQVYDQLYGDMAALEVSIAGTTDKIYFHNFLVVDNPNGEYYNNVRNNSVHQFRFDDGTVWDLATIASKLARSTDGNDTMLGTVFADVIDGQAGDDNLNGLAGDDSLIGGEGADILIGDAGSDSLRGGAGNDSLDGGAGDDVYLFGRGDGQDRVNYSYDPTAGKLNTLQLKSGVASSEVVLKLVYDDTFYRNSALEVSIAGTTDKIVFNGFLLDDDTATPYNSVQQIRFDDGSVWDLATIVNKVLAGTDEADTVRGTLAADALDGAAGNDNLNGLAGNDTLIGGEGADTLTGEHGDDSLVGGAGLDGLDGGAGNDTLDGGAGEDHLFGGDGDDVFLFGKGDGQDRIYHAYDPAAGKLNTLQLKAGVATSELVLKQVYDDVFGDNGALEISIAGTTDKVVIIGFLYTGDAANPYNSVQQISFDDGTVWNLTTIVSKLLAGTDGNDSTLGTLSADLIDGAAGDDNLNGLAGDDTLLGGEGADTLMGDAGSDSLIGGAGNDSIDGGAGDDTLDGGAGNDTLAGGDGNNVYRFGIGDGQDMMNIAVDFAAGKLNTLQLKAGVAVSDVMLAQVQDNMFGGNGALEVSLAGTTDKITFNGFLYGNDTNNPFNGLQQIRFDDGTVWNLATITSKLFSSTDSDDTRVGTAAADLLDGAGGNDNLNGAAGDDTLLGGEGADTLTGDAGSDSLTGGAGNDSLDGGADADILDGGAGNDTVNGGYGDNVYLFGKGDGQDRVSSTYDATAGKLNTLQLKAGVLSSELVLRQVYDDAFGGNRALEVSIAGSADKLTFNGFLQGDDAAGPYNGLQQIRFDDGTVWNLATIVAKTLAGTEGADSTRGSVASDLIDGAGGDDELNGAAGDDTLSGGEGADTLVGDGGADLLAGGAGNDSLDGGDNADTLDGGAGNDTLNGGPGDNAYLFGKGDGQDRIAVTYDPTGKLNTLQLKAGVLSSEVVVKQVYDDYFGGLRALEVSIAGTTDKVTINGFLQGDDTASPYNGLQQIRFDDGTVWNLDTIVGKTLASTEGGDTTRGTVASEAIDGAGGDDYLNGAAGDDTLTGGEGADTLSGEDGDDLLSGGAGNDSLDGGHYGSGDTLDGGAGNDILNGGLGENVYLFGKGDGQDQFTVYYDATSKLNTLQLKAGVLSSEIVVKQVYDDYFGGKRALEVSIAGTADKVTINGFLYGDDAANPYNGLQQIRFDDGTVWNLDTIVGMTLASTEGNDTTRGTVASDTLYGAGGNDELNGAAGDDSLSGGEGADTLSGEDWSDVLDGGAGNDSLDGGADADTLDGGAGNDTLNGGYGDNLYLFGKGDGQDRIAVFNDPTAGKLNTLQLKPGVLATELVLKRVDDDYFGGDSALEVSIAGSTDKLTVNGFFLNDDTAKSYNGVQQIRFDDGTIWDLATIENNLFDGEPKVLDGTAGDDTLTGAAGDDTLSGADGNDVLNGDLGNDSLAGGAGNDSLAGGAGNDVQFGGGDNDVLNGETGADALYGGSGDDVLDGGGDADLLFGGSGADVLNGGDDADQLYAQGPDDAIGGTGAVDLAGTVNVLNGGAGNDILRGGFGDDQLNGQVGNDDLHDEDGGNDSLDGGDGDDLLNGGQGNDSLEGGEGMDTLFGGTGDNSAVDADSLSGGAGDDVLVTGAAANGSARGTATDTLDGGAGNDVLYAGSDFRSDRAIMTGGAGADRFVLGNYGSHTLGDDLGAAAFGNFSQIGSAVFSNVAMPDRITDFTQSEGDLLRTGVINGFGGAGMPIVWRGVAGGGFTATLGQSIALASGGTSEARFLELWTSYDAGSDTTILFMDRDRDGIVGENDFKLEFDGELVLDKASFTPGTFADFKFGTGGADSDTGVALSNGNDFAFGYAGNDTLDGLDGNDILNGDQGSDSLSGGNGDDVIFGGAGDDAAVGGAGNDMLFGGSGADTLDGGEGADRMHADGADDVIGASGAGAAGSVEVLNGGAGNDLLVAGAGDAALNGQADNDTLIGGAGDDTLDGGEGADLLGGQGGDDVLDGGAGADGMSGGDGADTYFVDEAGDFVVEGDGAGSGQADHVNSYLAEYTLGANVENGRILSAAAANLAGNELDNILYAGSGDNVLAGAGGTDTVSYAHGGAGVVVDLNITGGQGTWGSGVDALSGIENLVGTAFADTLGGDSGANVLAGGAGDDVLDGGAGDDAMLGGDGADTYHVRQAGDTVVETNTANSAAETDLVFSHLGFYALAENVENGRIVSASGASITGNALDNTLYAGIGNNQLDGGAGNDTVSYLHATSSAGVAVSLALAGAQATGSSGSDTLSNVENLVGTDYADTLTGNAGANALTGGLGNDVLDGGSGADTMSGGDGADSYHVSETADVVIETDAAVGAAQADMVYSAASDYTLGANVEDARITSGGAANLSGNALDNIVHAGTGNNVLDGGTGADTLSYAFGAGSGVAVSLALTGAQATGGSGTDTVSNFENLVGTAFADTLTGDNGANALTGAAGNDVLDGGAGNDTMSGGDGADTYHVREAGDVVAETNASAGGAETDLVASYLATYTLGANVENGRVMSAAAANLVGNSLDNILYAGSGDNVLLGAGGIDTASYADAAAGVTVSLAASGAQATGGSGSDTLAGVENLVGTAFADALTGSSGANALTGGAGNDVLDGGAGADTMSGGDGADTYYVGDAGDMVVETNATGGAPEADLVVSNLAAYTL
ncbi:MAG: calcium-binding protein, partial [Pseudomonadota bacterium]